jgi:hypothetical protein
LGDDGYGATATVDDLQPVLSGNLFPKLTYLGLRNSEIVDDIAKALIKAPILDRIVMLDLSMGILSDEGGAALLSNSKLVGLGKLDLHHHFLTDEMMAKVKEAFENADLSDQNETEYFDDGEVYRYVAVSE